MVRVTLTSVSPDFFLELLFSSLKTECRFSNFFAGFFVDSENFFSELILASGTAVAGLERPKLVERVKLEE